MISIKSLEEPKGEGRGHGLPQKFQKAPLTFQDFYNFLHMAPQTFQKSLNIF